MIRPRFADIHHPDLAPDWMKEGLDEIYDRVGTDIRNIGFQFWVDNFHNDDNNFITRAEFYVNLSTDNGEDDQRRLDEIPSMRRLDRLSTKLWHLLPLSYDEEASIMGDTAFIIEPGRLEFNISDDCGIVQNEDMPLIRMVAEFIDGAWHCYDEITVYAEISETLRITPTTERLAEAIDLTAFDFGQKANDVKAISGMINEDGAVVLRFEPGLFKHYEAVGERE